MLDMTITQHLSLTLSDKNNRHIKFSMLVNLRMFTLVVMTFACHDSLCAINEGLDGV